MNCETRLMTLLRPPRIKDTKDDPSMGRYVTKEEIRVLREELGIKCKDYGHINHELSGWMHLSRDVSEHKDGVGLCLLYCGSGAGILWKEGKPVHMSEGFYTTFDDRKTHGFELLTKKCKLLVVSISRGIPDSYKDEYYV